MTWGISGVTFLILYGIALVLIFIGTVAWKAYVLRARGPGMLASGFPAGNLSVDEVAYLSGHVYGLGASALVGLRERGEATSVSKRNVQATGRPLSDQATPAQRAIHAELHRRGGYPAKRIGQLMAETPIPAAVQSSLTARGLLTSNAARRKARLSAVAYLALLAVGILRLVAGIHHQKPVGFLAILLVATVVIALMSLPLPTVTPAGRAALRSERLSGDVLRSASLPGDRALAVALFGVGALWLAEPAMADELGFARAQAAASGSDSTSSSSCGSSSSDGGSGGSSCGSSCGGGGCGG